MSVCDSCHTKEFSKTYTLIHSYWLFTKRLTFWTEWCTYWTEWCPVGSLWDGPIQIVKSYIIGRLQVVCWTTHELVHETFNHVSVPCNDKLKSPIRCILCTVYTGNPWLRNIQIIHVLIYGQPCLCFHSGTVHLAFCSFH